LETYGTPYELRLAERRANAVKNYLISIGIDASKLASVPLPAWDPLFQWIINAVPTRTLPSAFFYQDDKYTFFVGPTLTETTIQQWEKWAVPIPLPDPMLADDNWWKRIPIEPMVPVELLPIDPIGPIARFRIGPKEDWVINPATVYEFGERLVGRAGGLDVAVPLAAIGDGESAAPNHILPGSDVIPNAVVVGADGRKTVPGGLGVTVDGLNIVGGGGLNPVIREKLHVQGRLNLTGITGLVGGRFNQ
jgi:hypothetical protein